MKIGFLSHIDLNLYLFRLPVMKELLNKGHEVYAICPEGQYRRSFEDLKITYVSYSLSRDSINPFREWLTIHQLKKILKPLQLDILHTFTVKPNIYGSIAGKKAGIPQIINTVTGLGSYYVDKGLKSHIIRKVIEYAYLHSFKLSNWVIFQNTDDLNLYSGNIVEPEKTILIKGSGVDTEEFNMENIDWGKTKEIRKILGLKQEIVIMMISRAIWHKGVREFYHTAKILTEKYKNLKFIFVGESDPGNISCASEDFLRNGIPLWLGFRNDIKELLTICDIFVLPSYYREGLPRTLLEAASMSKPIVTTNTPGCRDAVKDGVNGYLVAPRNYIELAKKIEILILDDEKRIMLGNNGRERIVNKFDVKLIIDKYLNVYSDNCDV